MVGSHDSSNNQEIYNREPAKHLSGEINLRGVKVNGDVYLVSNRGEGPSIEAELSCIGGRLGIYSPNETEDSCNIKWTYIRNEIENKIRMERNNPNVMRRSGGRQPPIRINLESAQAKVFCHPFAAWPEMGGLRLSGFTYARTDPLGPLDPPPPPPRTAGCCKK